MDKPDFDRDVPLNCASVSVYSFLKSWVLQLPSEDDVEQYKGADVLKKVENVRLLNRYDSSKPSVGTLYLTATHLIFVGPDSKKETWILHNHISSAEKLPLTTTGSPLHIRCKNFLSATFVIPKERECHEIYITLSQLSRPVDIEDLYCFHYTPSSDEIPRTSGWSFFNLQEEYKRMNVPNDQWILTNSNEKYELCDTYPRHLYVPSSVTAQMLIGSSNFRSKGRLPVLSYLHKNKAAICRCSQPLSGFSARCVEDEMLLNSILKTNPNSSFMYVVDSRPRINAMANRATGKGYENELFYENIKFQFLGIENIHVMRSSLAKVIETCEMKSPTMSNFLKGLESSGWLKHIQSVLETSFFIAQAVDNGVSVVVHCSDGWDRTAQVCSLASLMLDSYYRTIEGFKALIEKEWLAFGHKFSERFAHLACDVKEVSPIFTQFIEGSWQLWNNFPMAFEFNERFLLTIHDHATSCQFGTFIGNCEKDRVDLRVNERTCSLWNHITAHVSEYKNPLYKADLHEGFIVPNLIAQNIRFWRGMYCRFESGVHPRELVYDILLSSFDQASSLSEHIKLLQKRITSLKTMLDDFRKGQNSSKEKKRVENSEDNGEAKDNKLTYEENACCDNSDIEKNQMIKGFDELGIKDAEDDVLTSESLRKELSSVALDELGIKDAEDDVLTSESLRKELSSVALDWKSPRNVEECSCSTPFDHSTRKRHCWKCGGVFCTRCIDKTFPLPGHLDKRPVPVCRNCFSSLRFNVNEQP